MSISWFQRKLRKNSEVMIEEKVEIIIEVITSSTITKTTMILRIIITAKIEDIVIIIVLEVIIMTIEAGTISLLTPLESLLKPKSRKTKYFL